jgi:hypothetical protein
LFKNSSTAFLYLEECSAEGVTLLGQENDVCDPVAVLVVEALRDPVLVVQVILIQRPLSPPRVTNWANKQRQFLISSSAPEMEVTEIQ